MSIVSGDVVSFDRSTCEVHLALVSDVLNLHRLRQQHLSALRTV